MLRKRRLRPGPLSRAGDHGHKAGRAGGGEEEETPEAHERGKEGRSPPSAWVRGRGVRLEAALGPPMATPLAGWLGARHPAAHLGTWTLAGSSQSNTLICITGAPARPRRGTAP